MRPKSNGKNNAERQNSIEKRQKIKEDSEHLEKERICQNKNYEANEIKRN